MNKMLVHFQESTAAWLRWGRRTFTREAIADFLKTLIWVAPLSVLIWVYADRNTTVISPQPQIIGFELTSDPGRIVTITRGDRSVTATLEGSKKSMDLVKDQLPSYLVRIQVPASLPLGRQSLPLTQPIRSAALFQDYAVNVTNVSPAAIEIDIDEIIKKQIKVEVPADTENLVEPTIFDPPNVTVTGPRKLLESQDIVAVADLSKSPEVDVPGRHEIVVPIRCSLADDRLKLDRSNVKVSLEVKANEVRKQLRQSVAIKVAMFQINLDKFRVVCDETIRGFITVTGPPEQINRLENPGSPDPFQHFAVLSPDPSPDQVGKELEGKLQMILPPGVRVVPEDEGKLTITYKVENREQ